MKSKRQTIHPFTKHNWETRCNMRAMILEKSKKQRKVKPTKNSKKIQKSRTR